MNIPTTKSCHKHGCTWHSRCALYRAEKAQIQIVPQHCAEHCTFFVAKNMPSEDFPNATDLAGCLE